MHITGQLQQVFGTHMQVSRHNLKRSKVWLKVSHSIHTKDVEKLKAHLLSSNVVKDKASKFWSSKQINRTGYFAFGMGAKFYDY